MSDITINHICIKANYSSNITDICAICRNCITSSCPKCETNNNIKCYGVIGVCSHMYHQCCITDWHKNHQKNCPTCSKPWTLQLRKTKK